MTVLLDAATKGTNTVITGGGLTVGASANTFEGARADTAKTTGKFVFEVAPALGSLATDTGFGLTKVVNPSTGVAPNYQSIAGTADDSLIIWRSGVTWVDGVAKPVNPGISGQVPMFAVDLDAGLAWIIVSDAAGWNNSLLANPVTGVGGIDISGIIGAGLYPVAVITSLANGGTFNFGASLFVHTPPSGYVSWDDVPPPEPVLNAVHNAFMLPFRSRLTGSAAGPPTGATLAFTERRDVVSMTAAPVVGAVMDNTEQADVFAGQVAVADIPPYLNDGEIIYVAGPEPTLYVQPEPYSPFVIPFESTLLSIPFSER